MKRLSPTGDDEYTKKSLKIVRMIKKREEGSMKGDVSLIYQRLKWDDLQKKINRLIRKVDKSNIKDIARELFSVDLIKGRGLFCCAILKSSMVYPDSTPVFAALVAVINVEFPEIGFLLLRRIAIRLEFIYECRDKAQLLPIVKLLANLVNQSVVRDGLAIQLLERLLQAPSDDECIEIAVLFLLECGYVLQDLDLDSIFKCFREKLEAGRIQKKTRCLIRRLFAIRKDEFSGYFDISPELYIVKLNDQITHEVSFCYPNDPELSLDVFEPDPHYLENEDRHGPVKRAMLGGECVESMSENNGDGDDALSEGEDEQVLRYAAFP